VALARLPVHVRSGHPVGHRLAGVDQVDAHAHVLGEGPGPVVPVGERMRALHRRGHDVVQPERAQAGQGLPFGRGDMGRAGEHRRVPHVGVGRRHVEVTGRDQLRLLAQLGLERGPQRRVPGQLVGVVRRLRGAPVGRVQRPDPDPAAAGPDRAGLRLAQARLVEQGRLGRLLPLVTGLAGKAQADVLQADGGQQGHPVPPALAVRGDLVAQRLDLGRGEQGRGGLDLLQADDVRLGLRQPLEQPGQPGLDRVHVPRRQPHPDSLPPPARRCHRHGRKPGGAELCQSASES